MLKEKQLKKLRNRDKIKPEQRKVIDYTSRKYLRKHLDALPDLVAILENLPHIQISRIVEEEDICQMTKLLAKLAEVASFWPVGDDGYVTERYRAEVSQNNEKDMILRRKATTIDVELTDCLKASAQTLEEILRKDDPVRYPKYITKNELDEKISTHTGRIEISVVPKREKITSMATERSDS